MFSRVGLCLLAIFSTTLRNNNIINKQLKITLKLKIINVNIITRKLITVFEGKRWKKSKI